MGKNLALLGTHMYRYSNGQISLSDFKRPVGMNLKESSRWVKSVGSVWQRGNAALGWLPLSRGKLPPM